MLYGRREHHSGRQFVLRLDDPAVVEMLSSEDHYRLGLFLVHPNYHRFQPSKK